MIFSHGRLTGLVLIDIERARDHRGFFARTLCREAFAAQGLDADFVQDSVSHNPKRGTLRGLHFQRGPHAETKLVRCVRGAILDIVVDIRPTSATYLDWDAYRLSAENGRALHIPAGFAHGFQTLEDETDVVYRISRPHTPQAASGLHPHDPALGIPWPEPVTAVAERDLSWPLLAKRGDLRGQGAAGRATARKRTPAGSRLPFEIEAPVEGA